MIKKIILIIVSLVIFSSAGFALDDFSEIPKDFKIIATVGGIAPGTTAYRMEIANDGKCIYFKRSEDPKNPFVELERFEIEDIAVERIYQSVKENDFFSLKESYIDQDVLDGSFAILTITANGKTHTVKTRNIAVERFDKIMIAINILTPGMNKLIYNAIIK